MEHGEKINLGRKLHGYQLFCWLAWHAIIKNKKEIYLARGNFVSQGGIYCYNL